MGRRGSPSSPRRPTMVARAPPPPPPVQPQQPGMFKQMAATAAGVAVGSAVGHAVGNAFSGGGSQPDTVVAQQPIDGYAAQSQHQQANPCQHHIDELVKCSQNQSDLGLCQGFSEALKECRKMYNIY